jgi:hypothetical protein
MFDSKRIEKLIGETVREIGTLVIVFAPLDAAFGEHPQAGVGPDLVVTMFAAFVLIASGIMLDAEE